MDTKEALCRWAEARYGLTGVEEVSFEPGDTGPWSDVTPGTSHLSVDVRIAGRWTTVAEVGFATELINDILSFAADPSSATA